LLLAPEAGIEHVAKGRCLRLAQFDHIEWGLGGVALAIIADARPNLLEAVVGEYVDNIAKAVSSPNRTFFDEAEPFIRILTEKTPKAWAKVLAKIDAPVAEKGLADCFAKGGGHGRTASLIVQAALGFPGPVGEMAQRLRIRFPSASMPPATSPILVSSRRKGHRRQSGKRA
jgi:hypothetical protein